MYDQPQEISVYRASLPYMQAAKAMAAAAQMNDHGPLHAQRVHAVAAQLARLFDLSRHEESLLLAAALLHDIGMAKDRENHHVTAEQLVVEMTGKGDLPFSPDEGQIVATLCRYHRGEYEPDSVSEATGVRVGLLASLLRLADAMDVDYRRSVDHYAPNPIIDHFYKEQAVHHLSVQSILGLRIYVGPLGPQLELYVERMSPASLQLVRLIDEVTGTPLRLPVLVVPMHSDRFWPATVAEPRSRQAVIFSYCNPHGLVQAAISQRQLTSMGFDVKVVCNRQQTGMPEVFWRDVFMKWDFDRVDFAVVLDLDIPTGVFHDVVTYVGSHRKTRWLYGSPLVRSSSEMKRLLEAGAEIVLADERVLFAGRTLDEASARWVRVAGLCNFDDPLLSSGGLGKQEYEVSEGLRYAVWDLWNANAPDEEYNKLLQRIVDNDMASFQAEATKWHAAVDTFTPSVRTVGRVLLVEDLKLPGRFVYDPIYRLIERKGLLPYGDRDFHTPFAIYKRTVHNGVSLLFMSRFSNPDHAYPIRYFVPQCDLQIGSCATVWQTYPDEPSAQAAIESTIKRIGECFDD